MRSQLTVFSLVAFACSAAQPVRAPQAMVVSREANATDVGVAVLRAGGNAVDAAVAVGFALAVTHPSAGNLGGGGFLLARFADGRVTFLDFREQAPGKAWRDMYLDAAGKTTRDSLIGYRAPGVPGTVRGLEYAHRKYGRKPWADLVNPSVALARHGFAVTYGLSQSLRSSKVLAAFPESRRIFLRDGNYYQPGEVLRQPELAATLERIAAQGAADFYEGETARRFAAGMAAGGGLITREDLRSYRVAERKPVEGSFRGLQLISAPPPSSGGVGLLQMLGVLAETAYGADGVSSSTMLHFLVEAMRRYYADRSEYLADPDFFKVPLPALLDRRYLSRLRASIDPKRATPSDQVKAGDLKPYESGETTHYSILDAEGNAVAVTYTLNGGFGCGVTLPGLGFLLNNEMDDFAAKPGEPNLFGLIQGEANRIEPRKRPLSSMTPTIAVKDGRPFLIVGSPGGSRIITTVLQVVLNVVDFKMNLQDAVNWPRLHHQWRPDVVYVEPGILPDTRRALQAMGHTLEEVRSLGEVSAIAWEGGWVEGAADPRVEGKAAGY